MNTNNRILILFAHPALQKSRVNRVMLEEIEGLNDITVHYLYEEYPDFHIDLKREQALLLEHNIIIFQHPFYWYSAPSIVYEWIDLVMEHNFAFGKTGTALKGKKAMNAITTGGTREAYVEGGFNKYTINQFLVPFEQTFKMCNLQRLSPYVVHGTHLMQSEEIKLYAKNYKEMLIALRDGKLDQVKMSTSVYMNDLVPLLTPNK